MGRKKEAVKLVSGHRASAPSKVHRNRLTEPRTTRNQSVGGLNSNTDASSSGSRVGCHTVVDRVVNSVLAMLSRALIDCSWDALRGSSAAI